MNVVNGWRSVVSRLCKMACVSLLIIFFTSVQAQNDSTQLDYMNERLREAATPETRAEIYYQDFVYAHGGYYSPYDPFYNLADTHRTQIYPYSADSALAILSRLYWQDGKEHLYYPIVQLEHFLGRRHDDAIIPPDTSEYYMPLQSGTYDDLGPGWETNYGQYLFPHVQWALLHCQSYTELFRTFGEPDLWHSNDGTAIRMVVHHLPGTGFTLIRVCMVNGQPTVFLRTRYEAYEEQKWSYVSTTEELKLSLSQWQEIISLATAIDTLPWKTTGTAIDGNRYSFEYRHGSSYHSHYTCYDHTGLSKYLFGLFNLITDDDDEFSD